MYQMLSSARSTVIWRQAVVDKMLTFILARLTMIMTYITLMGQELWPDISEVYQLIGE